MIHLVDTVSCIDRRYMDVQRNGGRRLPMPAYVFVCYSVVQFVQRRKSLTKRSSFIC